MPEVTLVCGPPCAGKTTLVLSRAQEGDFVVDHDLIARDLGSPSSHHHGRAIRDEVEQWIDLYLSEIAAGLHARAWVVRTLPEVQARRDLAERLGAEVLLLDPGIEVCKARAQSRPRPARAEYLIDMWYRRAAA